eukprot:COSAG01_NODE_37750_length_499_cov_1.010000_2_plen_89_part_01
MVTHSCGQRTMAQWQTGGIVLERLQLKTMASLDRQDGLHRHLNCLYKFHQLLYCLCSPRTVARALLGGMAPPKDYHQQVRAPRVPLGGT